MLVLAVAALLVGRTARERAEQYEQRAAALQRSLDTYDLWRRGYAPAAPAESAAWLESEQAMRDLGVTLGTRVALAELVARRAEEIGIPDVRVTAETSDTMVFAPLSGGGWQLELGALVLAVEAHADLAALEEFLAALPPQVDARHVRAFGTDGGFRSHLLLITYRNPNPTDAS